MKKNRRLLKEKLNSIVQSNYVVINLDRYNEIMYRNIITMEKLDNLYKVIYDTKMSYKSKFEKIKDIMLRR